MLTNNQKQNATQEPVTKPYTGDRMVLPIVGATPDDISQMADLLDDGEAIPGVPDRDLYERSYDACYLVQYDEHDHGFEDFAGVVWQ